MIARMIRQPIAGLAATVLLALAAATPLATPAVAQNNGLFGNLFKPPGEVSQEAGANGPGSASDLVLRMERLENALRNLTGQVEQLQYRNQQLEAQVRRLEEASGGGGKGLGAAAPSAPRAPLAPVATPTPSAGKRSDVFDPSADPAAPGAPQPLGSPGSASIPPRAASGPMDIGTPARPGVQTAALPSGGGSARELYDVGQSLIQRQDYAGAEQSFRQLLRTYPGDRLTPEATFMLGETLFLRQNYADAAASFLEVSTKYPNATRAPEALLRLGQSLAGMGERETACATFGEVDRKYPRAPASVRQAVEREQKRAGC